VTTLIDTCVLIDLLRGDERARRAFHAVVDRGDRLVGSVLTRTEIIAGTRSREEAAVAALLGDIGWLPVDGAVADRAGRYAQQYARSHQGIDLVDYVIAATTDLARADLLTRNVKHFPMYADLRAPY
jgi:predicted nucleic acid-binding protein